MDQETPEMSETRKGISKAAVHYSAVEAENFRKAVGSVLKALPIQTPQAQLDTVNAFVEATAATLVIIACEVSGSHGFDTEERIVKVVKDRFKVLRQNLIMRNSKGGVVQ